MTASVVETATAVPVVEWSDPDEVWAFRRRQGITGSNITAVLGFSGYDTQWEVWADKTGTHPLDDRPSAPAQLGTDLEPWLLAQAPALIGCDVTRAPARTYAHPAHRWRMYSPDGLVSDGRLFEAKTAGLASGFGTPSGWADGAVPLGYEFQVRWGLHVHDAPAAEVVALVAGMGLIRRTVTRDLTVEADLVEQVTDWWQRHVIDGVEPPLGPGDNATILRRYPTSTGRVIDLAGTDAVELWHAYRDARDRETTARADKETAGAGIKALLGDAQTGVVDDRVLATWGTKRGPVDFERMARDLADLAGVALPDPDSYRKPSSRSLSVKD